MTKDNIYYKNRINFFGKVLYSLKSVRFYQNGDGVGFVWIYWNPISWIMIPVFLIIHVLMVGIPDTKQNIHECGITLNPYFKKHPEKLVWV